MTSKWIPVQGEFLCPGKIVLMADEKGITIYRGLRALATSEWPGSNVRICQLVEEPDTALTKEMYWTIRMSLDGLQKRIEDAKKEFGYSPNEHMLPRIASALTWLENIKKESKE